MELDITLYKDALADELGAVTAELKTIGIHNPENMHDWVPAPSGTDVAEADENVSADHAEELEERTALVADLERRYNDTLRALKKITEGTYGTCEIAAHPIESERLSANPAARTCIEHREMEESLPL